MVQPSEKLKESLTALEQWVKAETSAFPYRDIKEMRDTSVGLKAIHSEDFCPDLNRWGMDIVGFAGWGRATLKWSPDRLERAQKVLSQSFFEKHPEYLEFEGALSVLELPALKFYFQFHESTRRQLLSILNEIQNMNR